MEVSAQECGCGKSCRLRWLNYLRDGLRRGNFSKQEDELIAKLHATHGNRWSLIASHLPGRTDNEIKNYWNSHLSRQFHGFRWTATASNDTTITIDINKLSAARKQRGGRAPGQSRSSSMKKQPVRDPTKAPDRSSPIGATSSASSLPLGDPDHNQPINNISVNHTSSESYSEDWIWPMVDHPVDQNGGVLEPNSALDRSVVWEANNSMKQIGILENENDMEALLSSIDMPASGLSGIEHGGQSWLEDLLDMDMAWEGFASHLGRQPTQNDLLQTTEPHATTCYEAGDLESFVSPV